MAFTVRGSRGSWDPARTVSVFTDANTWVPAKTVKALRPGGVWEIVWTPLSTVTITGPATALSAQSGTLGADPAVIVPSAFTITLGNTEPISRVALQQSNDGGTTWTDVTFWPSPVAATLTYSHTFSTAGNWLVRAAVTHIDTRIAYSNEHAVTVSTKNLVAESTNMTPIVFDQFLLGAAESAPAAASSQWMWRTGGGVWTTYGSDNPQVAWQNLAQEYEWTLKQTFPDGSIIYSSPLFITSTALAHFHEVVPVGGNIQAAMDRARDWFVINRPNLDAVDFNDFADGDNPTMACVELTPGIYDIGASELFYRRGVRLDGKGATIAGHGTHIFKGDNNGGGLYNSPNREWKIRNVILDCKNAAGGISSAHVFRYRLENVTIKNIQGGKHHVEVNSSGGPRSDTDYNVQFFGCSFTQLAVDWDEVRAEDEAIQLDYSWDGAAPNVANDGTVTNNVWIRDCNFDMLPRAVGGHSYNSQPTLADGVHSHILIEKNRFTKISPDIYSVGDANGYTSEGAVRSYYWGDTIIQDNHFGECLQPIMIYSPDNSAGAAYNMGLTIIRRNNIENCGGLDDNGNWRSAIYGGCASGGKKIGQIICEDNTLRGTWNGVPAGVTGESGGYFAGFDDTTGALPAPDNAYNVVIRRNRFEPGNYDLTAEADYNKYREGNDTNGGTAKVRIADNTISNGSVNNK